MPLLEQGKNPFVCHLGYFTRSVESSQGGIHKEQSRNGIMKGRIIEGIENLPKGLPYPKVSHTNVVFIW